MCCSTFFFETACKIDNLYGLTELHFQKKNTGSKVDRCTKEKSVAKNNELSIFKLKYHTGTGDNFFE